MPNSTFSLPGITSIAYIPSATLPANLALTAIAGMPIRVCATSFHIPFTGEPACECTCTNASNGSSQHAELSFQTTSSIPNDIHLAFLILSANSELYLLGTKEAHPLIESNRSFGSPEGDPSTTTYTVSLSAPIALIPCRLL